MTVLSLKFTCDMCNRKEVVDLRNEQDIEKVGTELVLNYPDGDSNKIQICRSCVNEIKKFINMYPMEGE